MTKCHLESSMLISAPPAQSPPKCHPQTQAAIWASSHVSVKMRMSEQLQTLVGSSPASSCCEPGLHPIVCSHVCTHTLTRVQAHTHMHVAVSWAERRS